MMSRKMFPKLYKKSATGKFQIWWVEVVEGDKGVATILVHHGAEEGKIIHSAVSIDKGKNLGRSNQTTPYTQALSEAEAKWNKKHDAGYRMSKQELEDDSTVRPMLAHNFDKRKKDIEWPAYVQPKLDGVRCLAHKSKDGKIEFYSRLGKPFPCLGHIGHWLSERMVPGEIFDGELFNKNLTFQEITSRVKKHEYHEDVEDIEYWIFDVVQNMDFAERSIYLEEALDGCESPLVRVPTIMVKNEARVHKFHDIFSQEELYEGVMVRNGIGTYKQGYRSPDLQKLKNFIDGEFTIVGGLQGTGKDEGTVIFICETEDKKRFNCRPRGSHEYRTSLLNNLPELLNQKLTVRYQKFSDDGIPVFPVGINIRDYE